MRARGALRELILSSSGHAQPRSQDFDACRFPLDHRRSNSFVELPSLATPPVGAARRKRIGGQPRQVTRWDTSHPPDPTPTAAGWPHSRIALAGLLADFTFTTSSWPRSQLTSRHPPPVFGIHKRARECAGTRFEAGIPTLVDQGTMFRAAIRGPLLSPAARRRSLLSVCGPGVPLFVEGEASTGAAGERPREQDYLSVIFGSTPAIVAGMERTVPSSCRHFSDHFSRVLELLRDLLEACARTLRPSSSGPHGPSRTGLLFALSKSSTSFRCFGFLSTLRASRSVITVGGHRSIVRLSKDRITDDTDYGPPLIGPRRPSSLRAIEQDRETLRENSSIFSLSVGSPGDPAPRPRICVNGGSHLAGKPSFMPKPLEFGMADWTAASKRPATLRRQADLVLVAVLTLALGIGAKPPSSRHPTSFESVAVTIREVAVLFR